MKMRVFSEVLFPKTPAVLNDVLQKHHQFFALSLFLRPATFCCYLCVITKLSFVENSVKPKINGTPFFQKKYIENTLT